ncbi:MAG: Nramp family divalent metal transporter [Candidatus Wallbacteria bacterium]
MNKLKHRWKEFVIFLSLVGPGIITGNVDNDAGGIATYSIAGARYGYSMLWTLIPVTILLIYTLNASYRMGAATGQGLGDLIREKFRVRGAFILLFLVFLANLGTTTSEFAGIYSSIQIIGTNLSREIMIFKNPIFLTTLTYLLTILLACLVWLIVVKGTYKLVERVFMIACVFYFSYVLSAFYAKPNWSEVWRGFLIPTFQNDKTYLFDLIGVIGTTITPWMNFYMHASMLEKGITAKNYHVSKWDVVIGSIMTDIMSFFMIVACGATLFVNHVNVETVEDIGKCLIPVAGNYSSLLFAAGLFNASVFASAILPLSTAYAICETFGWEIGIEKDFKEAKMFYTIFTSMIVLGCALVLVPGMPLLFIMRLSQVANGLLLPIFLFYLISIAADERIMGKFVHTNFERNFGKISTIVLTILSLMLVYGYLFN